MTNHWLHETPEALCTATPLLTKHAPLQDIEDAFYDTEAAEQLAWLHQLHQRIDEMLRHIAAIKIDASGMQPASNSARISLVDQVSTDALCSYSASE